MGDFKLGDYVDVASRLALAYERWPEMRLVESIPTIVDIGGNTFIQVSVTAYRQPDDPVPCSATAWEPFPGRTPYTKNSEMMNASTSATGRVLGLMGIGSKKSIASADEVRRRTQDTELGDAVKTSKFWDATLTNERLEQLQFLSRIKGVRYDDKPLEELSNNWAEKLIKYWSTLENVSPPGNIKFHTVASKQYPYVFKTSRIVQRV